jgi:hypothetical protein
VREFDEENMFQWVLQIEEHLGTGEGYLRASWEQFKKELKDHHLTESDEGINQ